MPVFSFIEGNTSEALARVGFALRAKPSAASAAWAVLDADLPVVRSSIAAPQREAFDLVVAVRGLATGGNCDWGRAEKICSTLGWPRCDKEALAELRERSVP